MEPKQLVWRNVEQLSYGIIFWQVHQLPMFTGSSPRHSYFNTRDGKYIETVYREFEDFESYSDYVQEFNRLDLKYDVEVIYI